MASTKYKFLSTENNTETFCRLLQRIQSKISWIEKIMNLHEYTTTVLDKQHKLASLCGLVLKHTSARTILSIMVCSVSSNLHLCTPSNHSLRCSLAFLSDTSRLLYVFSAAKFCNVMYYNNDRQAYKSTTL